LRSRGSSVRSLGPWLSRISELRDKSPELAPFLGAMRVALGAAELPLWKFDPSCLAPSRPAGAPLLTDASLSVERSFVRELFDALVAALGEGKGAELRASLAKAVRAPAFAAVELLEAAIDHDKPRIEQMANELHTEPQALAALAQLGSTSLLHAARGALAPDPFEESAGGCPFCGAHPTLAEVRGLERVKRLRCGRCGADFGSPTLSCAYCGERDHHKLGMLLPEGAAEQQSTVDVCASCGGYLKVRRTLLAIAPGCVPLEDLASVELDLAALSRGHSRPAEPACAPRAKLRPLEGSSGELRRLLR
jgi:FdhE protein